MEGGWSTPRPGRFTPAKTRYPLYRRLGGPQGRSGQVRNITPSAGFDPRTVQPVARPFLLNEKKLFYGNDIWEPKWDMYEGWNFNSGNYLFTIDTK